MVSFTPKFQNIISWLKSVFIWLHHEVFEVLQVFQPLLQTHFTEKGINDICHYTSALVSIIILFTVTRLIAHAIANMSSWFMDLILRRSFHIVELAIVSFFSRIGRSLGFMIRFLLGGRSGRQ